MQVQYNLFSFREFLTISKMSHLECCLHISHFKSIQMLASEILACESTLISLLEQPAPNIQADKF